MRCVRFVVLCGCAAATLASPVPPACISGTLASYLALANGCTIGPQPTFSFSDFSFNAMVTKGAPSLLSGKAIDVTPMNTVPSELALQFSSSGFDVGSGQAVEYIVSYTVDPPPPEILHFALALDPPTSTGLVQIKTELCVGAPFIGTDCPSGITDNLTVFQLGTAGVLTDTVSFPGVVAQLGVINTITINGSAGISDPASFSSFDNTTLTSIPEPPSSLLAACGIALLGLLARRVRAKLR